MTSRERVLAAFRRTEPDNVPTFIRLAPALADAVREAVGTGDFETHFGLDLRLIPLNAPCPAPDVRPYIGEVPEGATVSPWGSVWVRGDFFHFGRQIAPMREFTSARELDAYPFPVFAPDVAAMRAAVQQAQDAGLAAVSGYHNGPYEQACALRGQAEFLADLALEADFASVLLERITDIKCELVRAHVASGVDVIWIGDDLGMQDRLVFSPETWRRFIRPCLRRIVSAIRETSEDVLIAYHSCGHVEPLAGALADEGIEVLESVQPEANDVARLKRDHGERLSFWGTVGDQSTLPYGSAEDVRDEVRERLETVGQGGGLLISPAHVVEPEVPVANVLAFFEAVGEFGAYRV